MSLVSDLGPPLDPDLCVDASLDADLASSSFCVGARDSNRARKPKVLNCQREHMLRSVPFSQPLGYWDASQVTNMCDDKLADDNHASKQALSDWDTSQVTNMCNGESVNDNVFDGNAGLSRAGCGATEFVDDNLGAGCCATEFVDDNLGIDPPQVDWAGIPLAQDGPWLRGIDRNYIEVSSFCFWDRDRVSCGAGAYVQL